MNNNEIAVLLDISAIMYRAFYAHLNLRNDSEPTGATFGFLNTLLGVFKEFEPKYIIGAFDVSRKSLERTKIYEKYKADRKPMPEDLAVQIKRIEELLDIFGIKRVKVEGHEADDVLGSYAKRFSKQGIETFIVTGDKDLSQVLDDNINIALLGKGEGKSRFKILRTPEDVMDQLGVFPESIPNLFGLIGDSSDGIPGVRKIGIKKAVPMLQLYGDLEGIYENLDKVSEISGIGKSLINNLKEDKELAFLSRELAVIKTDIDIDCSLEDMLYKKDSEKLLDFVKELNFKSHIKKLSLEIREGSEKESKNSIRIIKIMEKIRNLIKEEEITLEEFIEISKEVEKDFENSKFTSCNDKNEINCEKIDNFDKKRKIIKSLDEIEVLKEDLIKSEKISLFSNDEGIVFVTDKDSFYISLDPCIMINKAVTLKVLEPLFEIETPFFVYGYKNLLKKGINVKNIKCDLFIGSYLLTNHTKEEIETLVLGRVGTILETRDEILKRTGASILDENTNFEFLEKRAQFIHYNGEEILNELASEKLDEIYNIEMNLVKILFQMEKEGILIDTNYFKEYQKELTKKLDKIIPEVTQEVKKGIEHQIEMLELTEDEIKETLLNLGKLNYKKKAEFSVYEERLKNSTLEELLEREIIFNIASPKQLGIVLFQLMKLNKVKKESVGVEVLEILRDRDGEVIADKILEYRKLSKLQSTYVEALPKLVDEKNRIHTTFNQTGTATGRLSSSNPNLQNIPVRTPEGVKIRQGFIAKEGYKLLAIDYSQIELRVLAEISKDETLILAYKNDLDLHALTARNLFSLAEEEDVTREMRAMAKIVNFSIIYGKTAFGLANELKITQSEAKEYISRYFKQYPKVKLLETKIIEKAKEDGYVRTLYNRKRIINNLNSSNKNIVKQGERMAVNSVIQGTAADILKMIMVELGEKLKGKDDIKLTLQVHDELIFEVKEEKVREYGAFIKDIMENTVNLENVKLKANLAIGKNWSEAK